MWPYYWGKIIFHVLRFVADKKYPTIWTHMYIFRGDLEGRKRIFYIWKYFFTIYIFYTKQNNDKKF